MAAPIPAALSRYWARYGRWPNGHLWGEVVISLAPPVAALSRYWALYGRWPNGHLWGEVVTSLAPPRRVVGPLSSEPPSPPFVRGRLAGCRSIPRSPEACPCFKGT